MPGAVEDMTLWGSWTHVAANERVRWHLGPRRIWVERHVGEWQIGTVGGGPDDQNAVLIDREVGEDDGEPRTRVARAGQDGEILLEAMPPDRPIIARTPVPFVVPAESSADIVVGVPLWVQVRDRKGVLFETPLMELSSTWFGTPTEGVPCYATRTHMALAPETIGAKVHRAVCRATIVNEGPAPLELDRLRVPAPMLGIYRGPSGEAWASPVRLVRARGVEEAEVTVVAAPSDWEKVGQARQAEGRVVRAFNAVFRSVLS